MAQHKTALMREVEDFYGKAIEDMLVEQRYVHHRTLAEIAELWAVSYPTVCAWSRQFEVTFKADAFAYRLGQVREAVPQEDAG